MDGLAVDFALERIRTYDLQISSELITLISMIISFMMDRKAANEK